MDPNVDALLWNGRPRDSGAGDRIYGVVPAVVIAIRDESEGRHRLGSVKVRFPWLCDLGTAADIAPWARCVTFAGGGTEGSGWVSTPHIGDEVLVGFEHGDLRFPYVLGMLVNPKVATAEAAGGPGSAGGAGSASEAPRAAAALPTHWLEIEMSPEEAGAEVAGVGYEVRLADGSVRRGHLDGDGRARLDRLPAGTCEVRFPSLGDEEWQPA
jgi:hypothetical protein